MSTLPVDIGTVDLLNMNYTFNPGFLIPGQDLPIDFIIQDKVNYPIYTFYLFILNDDPVFSPLLTTQTVKVGLTKFYILTTFDFEGAPVTITL